MPRSRTVSFGLGAIVATPGALSTLEALGLAPIDYLRRHARGDWGELCEEDKEANAGALRTGARLMSAYALPDGAKLWLITEAEDERGNRAATTLLLPEEY